MEERLFLVAEGREKSPSSSLPLKRPSTACQSHIPSALINAAVLTCAVAYLWPKALPRNVITVSKHTKVPSLETAQRDLLDNGRRDGAQQQEHKGDEEY